MNANEHKDISRKEYAERIVSIIEQIDDLLDKNNIENLGQLLDVMTGLLSTFIAQTSIPLVEVPSFLDNIKSSTLDILIGWENF